MTNTDIFSYCHLSCVHISCYDDKLCSQASLEDRHEEDEMDIVSTKAIGLEGSVSLQWKVFFQCKGKHTVLCNTFTWKNTFCEKSSRYDFL